MIFIVSQHRQGKRDRMITLKATNEMQMAYEIILKSLTGVNDGKQPELDLPVTLSPSGSFQFPY